MAQFIINVADIPHPEHPGKSYRQVNAEMQHKFSVGQCVMYNGSRYYIHQQSRDCDQEPLYTLGTLSPKTLDERVKNMLSLFIMAGNDHISEAGMRLIMEDVVLKRGCPDYGCELTEDPEL